MADEDITKGKRGKKPRHREPKGEVYLSNAHPLPTPEQLRALLAELAADEEQCATPDAVKGTAGNPVPPAPGARPVTDRVSPPLTAGHAAPSTGDHGAAFSDPMNQPGPRALAYRHGNLRQGTTDRLPLVAMTTQVGDDQNHDRDVTYWHGQVGLDRLDAAAASGMPGPSGNPAARQAPHIARDSATMRNGTHGLGDVVSHGGPALKASEARAVMKRYLFGGNGAR